MTSAAPDNWGGQPRASVIVLGYNGAHYLEACLSSLVDQDMTAPFEIVYADNCSTDGSVSLVRERFPYVRIVEFDTNHGFAVGNNLAVPHTSGEWIVFLNQDTVAARSFLRELIDCVGSSPDIMAGHANIIHPWYPDFAGLDARAESPNAYSPDLTRWGYCRYRNLGRRMSPQDVLILSGAALALRRSVIDELGYVFDPEFWSYAEDWDLGLRLRALGHRCVMAPRSTVYHLYTPKTKFRYASFKSTIRNIRNRYLAFYKVMPWREFIPMAGLLTLGSPLNAFEFGLKPVQKVLFAAALVPTTAVALAAAASVLPRFSRKRKEVLERRSQPHASCLKRVWLEPLRSQR
jgi:GT2 family glycosyltransferase